MRQFKTGLSSTAEENIKHFPDNEIPDISSETAAHIAASAPVKIRQGRGNPRQRRYHQKTYSLLQEDIERIESLLLEIRKAGLYDRSRSDIVRAAIQWMHSLPLEQKVQAVCAVENLKAGI